MKRTRVGPLILMRVQKVPAKKEVRFMPTSKFVFFLFRSPFFSLLRILRIALP
jgi:hypothetical protein